MLLLFQTTYAQDLSNGDGYIRLNIDIQKDSLSDDNSIVILEIQNISSNVLFVYNGDVNSSKYLSDTIVSMDMGSGFITDPLLFPNYSMDFLKLCSNESTTIHKRKAVDTDTIKEVRCTVEYIVPDIVEGKRLRNKIIRKLQKGKLRLKNYWQHRESYAFRYFNH